MGYDRRYFLKKAFGIYPGVVRPVSGSFLAEHYRRRRAERGVVRAGLDALVGLGFKVWIPWRAKAVQRKFGLGEDWRERAVRMARSRFADPQDIALFRLEEPQQLEGYIRRFEDAALNKRINPKGWTPGCTLADKKRFYELCAEHKLPHPGTVALVIGGRVSITAPPAGRDLLAKPSDGEGGDGVQGLGRFEDPDALSRELNGRFGKSKATWIIQPRVPIHPELADLALNALPTVRIVTILDEKGQPEVVSATVRFASDPAAEVDNMKAGGLLAAVDLDTGSLGIACKGYGGGDYEVHPVTGAPIVGRVLPGWEEAKALARRAHAEAFSEYALLGWDLAMLPEGPLLIEGNGKPGVLMPQRAARRGLGDTRYGELLAFHLALSRRKALARRDKTPSS